MRLLPPILVALLLAGCAQKPLIQRVIPPNPFGYEKVSAVCRVTSPVKAPSGALSVAMTVRSDDGLCAVSIQRPLGGQYASFGVDPAPVHGHAFLYNYDDHTYVTYTPATAFAGTDNFTVVLIPGKGQTRTRLNVTATVDATGVVAPAPQVPVATAPSPTPAKKTATRRRSTRHH